MTSLLTKVSALALALSAVTAAAADGASAKPAVTSKPAKAAKAAKQADAPVPLPLALALQNGLKLEKQFEAAGGMTGWVVSEGPGQNRVFFSPPDGTVLISGVMVDAQGKNLTAEYLEKFAPRIDYDKEWSRLEKSSYISEGASDDKAKSIVYVFKDANCSFCHLSWLALKPYQKVGLQVRWIPVAFLKSDSYNKAAYLLTAKNPEDAIEKSHAAFGANSPDVQVSVSGEMRNKIDANNRLMHELGFRGTPALLYKNAQGKAQAINGMFRLGQIPEFTGLPAQPVTDPKLASFR